MILNVIPPPSHLVGASPLLLDLEYLFLMGSSVLLKGRRTRDQIANIRWIIGKAREFQKNIRFIDYAKAFACVDHDKLWKKR